MVTSNHFARFLTFTDQLLFSCSWMSSKYYFYCTTLYVHFAGTVVYVAPCVEFCIHVCAHITRLLGSCLPRPLSLLRGFVWAVSPAWKMVLGQGRFLRMEPKPEPRSDFSCNDNIYCYLTVLFYQNTHMHTHVISQCWLIWLTDFFEE